MNARHVNLIDKTEFLLRKLDVELMELEGSVICTDEIKTEIDASENDVWDLIESVPKYICGYTIKWSKSTDKLAIVENWDDTAPINAALKECKGILVNLFPWTNVLCRMQDAAITMAHAFEADKAVRVPDLLEEYNKQCNEDVVVLRFEMIKKKA